MKVMENEWNCAAWTKSATASFTVLYNWERLSYKTNSWIVALQVEVPNVATYIKKA